MGGVFGSVAVVAADGSDFPVIVEPRIVHPGDSITIHSPAMWTEVDVVVTLVSSTGATRALGSATTGPDGSLEMRATVPADMPEGRFQVVVTAPSGESKSVELVIEAPFPVLPTLVLGVAILAAIAVGASVSRRRRAPF